MPTHTLRSTQATYFFLTPAPANASAQSAQRFPADGSPDLRFTRWVNQGDQPPLRGCCQDALSPGPRLTQGGLFGRTPPTELVRDEDLARKRRQ